MVDVEAPVTGVREVASGMLVLAFDAPEISATARAGQFVNLLLRPGPLLRRPFSVYRTDGDLVEVIFKPVGEGTRLMARLRSGDRVRALGPLGRGFSFDPGWQSVALVSGGLGVAPMPLAAREAAAAGLKVIWAHGARTSAELCPEWEGDEVAWATDDGSRGRHGRVTDAVPAGAGAVLACGPNPMLAAVARRWPDAQVAVETLMGCGTGVCLGCAVAEPGGAFSRACREGPVYRGSAIDWTAMPALVHA